MPLQSRNGGERRKMRAVGILVAGAALLAGCMSAQSSGVVSLGPDLLGVTVASRNLAGAASRAMGDAAGFCAGLGRQAELLKTEVSPADYRLTFRCNGTPQPALAGLPGVGGVPAALSSAAVREDIRLPSWADTRQGTISTRLPATGRSGAIAPIARAAAPAADDVRLPSLASTRQRIGAAPLLPAADPEPTAPSLPALAAAAGPPADIQRLPPPGRLVPTSMAVPPAGFWNLQ
jgi:hypothetical protein